MLILLVLLGCAHGGVQIDLKGWQTYLPPPVVVTDEDLALGLSDVARLQVQGRLTRCQAHFSTCTVEVRILRNDHRGPGHLAVAQVVEKLTAAGFADPQVSEQVDRHSGGNHNSCNVLIRVLGS